MKPLSACSLYTFIDTAYLHGRAASEIAHRLCAGGADIIQLRAKGASPSTIARMADEVVPVAEASGVRVIINDHPEIAVQLPHPFCHLGQEDFFDAGLTHTDDLRRRLQPATNPAVERLAIGLSTHAPEQAERAVAAGADYIAIGPVHATSTKPTARPVTLDYVRWAARHVTIPWFAIGGINLENVRDVVDAGARRICVVSAILSAPDITEACHQFRNSLPSAGS